MNKAIKRIVNIDMKLIDELKKSNIYIEFDQSNILKAYAIIFGPSDTIYEGSVLYFDINFPTNYPFNPLNIKYNSNGNNLRIHPNIYTCGKVCLSILGTWPGPKWTSIMNISSVLLSIKSLLDNEPLFNEPGFYKKNKKHMILNNSYNEVILHNKVYFLYNNNSKVIPINFLTFKDIIDKYHNDNKDLINNIILINKDINKKVVLGLYRIDHHIKYDSLLNKI